MLALGASKELCKRQLKRVGESNDQFQPGIDLPIFQLADPWTPITGPDSEFRLRPIPLDPELGHHRADGLLQGFGLAFVFEFLADFAGHNCIIGIAQSKCVLYTEHYYFE